MKRSLLILLIIGFSIISLGRTALSGQTIDNLAPGAPGSDAHWPSAAKNGFGTADTIASKVWFTLADGVLTEVYYPTLDVPNVQTLQLVVVSGDRRIIETEEKDTTHEVQLLDPQALTFRQMNKSQRGDYVITKTYIADPKRPTILIHVTF